MTSAKRYVQLYNATAAGTSPWFRLDSRYEKISVRPIHFSITSGDTFTLQAIVKDVKGIDETYLNSLLSTDIATIGTFTTTSDELLEGNYTWVRVVKTGTAGLGVVEGFI
jgi:hypothetical protein